jgi:hypothetical protein
MTARRIELVSGIAAAVLGVLGWAWAVFGPTYLEAGSYSTGRNTPPMVVAQPGSLAQALDLASGPIVFLLAVLVCVVAIGIGAYLHAARAVSAALPMLVMATLFLVGGVVLSVFTVGPFLVPAAILAALASIAGWRTPQRVPDA